MDVRIQKIRKFREFLLKQIEGLSAEQLNKIPEGYSNNIIWNIGHLICSQQSLCYFRSGLTIKVDDKYYSPYKTFTKPDGFIDEQEIAIIKNLLLTTIDDWQLDYANNIFNNYSASEGILKVYGVELSTIEDAIEFLLYHEGFHSGYIISLIHLVK
ncbi:MAG: DinB family protein [Bacteroidetes bacterium]|nr:DinB family protein [Bacteroidota bacterium]